MSARACAWKTERLSALEKVWHGLFALTRRPTPFVSYEWFAALARCILKCDPEVLVFVEDDAVTGIVPAGIADGKLKMIGDERVTDMSGIVSTAGHEERVAEGFARLVDERGLGLDLFPLEAGSPLVAGLRDRLTGVVVEKKDACPLLALPQKWDDYLAGLDAKARHELRRKMRKINGDGTVLQDVSPRDIEILFRLMVLSDRGKDEFLTADMRPFFRELAEVFGRSGWLRMRALLAGQRPAGIVLAFGLQGRIYLYNMGFDPEYQDLSPGIVTIALDIRSAIDEGYRYYDFLRGGEDYKYRLGAVDRQTVRVAR
ncbi:GNAT family N-acetyltransferase [candidate division WOR-3 bacterium]|nr:GNAT family N-acetyltransferase [candidate division WOR-3 bacterium]